MKKWIVLAALALSVGLAAEAGATGGRMRVVGLTWDTWTPQGPVVGADTTFISGATQTQDTTGVFDATKIDWNPLFRLDPNATNVQAFKVYISGTNISVDTITVTIQGSMDKVYWYDAKAATAVGRPTTHGSNFDNLTFAYSPNNASGDAAAATFWPYFRFIIKADGNTAARHTATKCKVVSYVADDRIATAPRLVWRQLSWGTWAAGAFSPEKDTTSVAGNAVDTTASFSWANAMLGPGVPPAVGATAADSNMVTGCLFVQQTSDPSSLDSIYVAIQGSVDNYKWSTNMPYPALTLNAGYMPLVANTPSYSVATATTGFAGHLGAINTGFSTLYSMSAFGTPFMRCVVKAGAGGEVASGLKVWVGQWVAPGSELAD